MTDKNYSSIINIGHGDPTIFREWWIKHNILPDINTRTEKIYEYQEKYIELIGLTHKFHKIFGTDCETAGIVYGNGSTQVINAILYAICRRMNRCIVVGYKLPVYMLMHEFLTYSKWIEVTFDLERTDIDVEIVIDPNNPSGEKRVKCSNATYTIYDRAYNWPIYIDPVSETSCHEHEITVYTMSKCMGMGGIRIGWAFVNNEDLQIEIQQSLLIIGICPNTFGIDAAKCVFSQFINNSKLKDSYIQEISNMIKERVKHLENNAYFIITNTSGPYAWIKSINGEDISHLLLVKYGIKVYPGTLFGSSNEYARLSLICSDQEFKNAIHRMKCT